MLLRPLRTKPAGGCLAVVVLCLSGLAATPVVSAEAVTVAASAQTTAGYTLETMPSGVYERRLLHWTNVQRSRRDRARVRGDRCADRYAERWTRHLLRVDRLIHRDLRVLLRGCDATAAGEVRAHGRVWPRAMVRMWMRSRPHRAILLSGTYRSIGIGARTRPDGSWLATQNYLRR